MQIDVIKLTTEGIAICSVLHTVLPPWEAFNDFPTLQKYYKLLLYVIGYAALNGRSTVWQSVSTKNGTQPSPVALQSGAANPNPVIANGGIAQTQKPQNGGK